MRGTRERERHHNPQRGGTVRAQIQTPAATAAASGPSRALPTQTPTSPPSRRPSSSPAILAGSRPGDVVLDPFMGSGTVAEVAQRLERRWLGVELNPDYHTMQARRTAQGALPLEVDP